MPSTRQLLLLLALALLPALDACQSLRPKLVTASGSAQTQGDSPAVAPPDKAATPRPSPPLPPPTPARPPRVALALGAGAARGFAHVGVIKALEDLGIEPQIVVGSSAGSFVAALYAAGYAGADLQEVALQFQESQIADWAVPARGLLKGEALQDFVNRKVDQRPMEQLPRKLAIVATDLRTGAMVVFERGNVGMAVRASSSVPGIFQPVRIAGHEYVDGGLVSPVPVHAARNLGADVVIAVDISQHPADQSVTGTVDIILQSFAIMGQAIAANELQSADIVLRPALGALGSTDFSSRVASIREGEQCVQAQATAIDAALDLARRKLATAEAAHTSATLH